MATLENALESGNTEIINSIDHTKL